MKKSKKMMVIALPVLIVALIWGFLSQQERVDQMATYTNLDYGISLKYPEKWQANPSYDPPRYESAEGFFQISALSGEGMTLDEVAQMDATHRLSPYGTNPKIEPIKISGQEARLIIPATDQPAEMKQLAGLIIQYPSPRIIGQARYGYFILWADVKHIRALGQTLQFTQ